MYQPQQNGSTPKRTRTGARGEGDWTCPNCGNSNFGFRATCNIRTCGAAKPATADGAPPPMMAQQQQQQVYPAAVAGYDPTGYMAGSGGYVPPAQQQPQYGAPMMMMPPPEQQQAYAAPAAPLYQPQPQPYMMQPMNGMQPMAGPQQYGVPPAYAPYGQPVGPPAYMGPPGGVMIPPPSGDPRKRRAGEEAEGEWVCPKCENRNFSFRTICNMRKCGQTKPLPPDPRLANAPPGSWLCAECSNVNYPFRTNCNRPGCSAPKPADGSAPPPMAMPAAAAPASGGGGGGGVAPEGSWSCPSCGNTNYPFRSVCNRKNCGAQKPEGAAPESSAQQ